MTSKTSLLVALAGVLGAAQAAEAKEKKKHDAPAPVARPAWCGDYKNDPTVNVGFMADHSDANRVEAADLFTRARAVCQGPDNTKMASIFEQMRASYMKQHAITEDEMNEEIAAAVKAGNMYNEWEQGCKQFMVREPEEAGLLTRELKRIAPIAIGCKTNEFFDVVDRVPAIAWYLDFPDTQPSQIALAANIVTEQKHYPELGYVVGALDAKRLDRKALDAEIDALKLNPTMRAHVLHLFHKASHVATILAAPADDQAKELAALPERAQAEWDKLYAAHKDDFDAAFAIEKKVMDLPPGVLGKPTPIGCADLHKRFRAYAASTKPKSPEDVEAATHDPVGFVLLQAAAVCDAAEGHSLDANVANAVLFHDSTVQFHGPRLLARAMAFEAARAAVKAGKPPRLQPGVFLSDRLPPGKLLFMNGNEQDARFMSPVYEDPARAKANANARSTKQGKVKSVKKTDTGAVISFKAEKWTEPDEECTKLGIINWQADGTPIYEYKCKVVGYHEESYTIQDLNTIDADVALALKPGQMVRMAIGNQVSGKPSNGVVFMAGDVKGKDVKWSSMLGVPIAAK